MAFTARLYIQGVGVTRFSDDGLSLDSYFPTNLAAREFDLIDAAGIPRVAGAFTGEPPQPICEHFAFIQFSARNLDPDNHDVWLTAMLDKERVDVEAVGADSLSFDRDGVEDVANLSRVLAGLVPNPRQLREGLIPDPRKPREDFVDRRRELLNAEVHVPYGTARGYLPRRWDVGTSVNVRMSGAVQIMLGQVDELALRITSFEAAEGALATSRVLRFVPKPPANDCDIWIRHFCRLDRPDPNPAFERKEQGDTDPDFVLNYALLEEVRHLTLKQKRMLPIPVIRVGGQIGGNHTICQRATVSGRTVSGGGGT